VLREPLRTCIGCRATRPQRELRRCVVDADGTARTSRTAAGRGAWVCSAACATRAARKGGFARAWRRPVDAAALAPLLDSLVTTHEDMRQSRAAGHLAGTPSPTKG
jgi:predicted RNA-binding protein YlxR (DUF448 family)